MLSKSVSCNDYNPICRCMIAQIMRNMSNVIIKTVSNNCICKLKSTLCSICRKYEISSSILITYGTMRHSKIKAIFLNTTLLYTIWALTNFKTCCEILSCLNWSKIEKTYWLPVYILKQKSLVQGIIFSLNGWQWPCSLHCKSYLSLSSLSISFKLFAKH